MSLRKSETVVEDCIVTTASAAQHLLKPASKAPDGAVHDNKHLSVPTNTTQSYNEQICIKLSLNTKKYAQNM